MITTSNEELAAGSGRARRKRSVHMFVTSGRGIRRNHFGCLRTTDLARDQQVNRSAVRPGMTNATSPGPTIPRHDRASLSSSAGSWSREISTRRSAFSASSSAARRSTSAMAERWSRYRPIGTIAITTRIATATRRAAARPVSLGRSRSSRGRGDGRLRVVVALVPGSLPDDGLTSRSAGSPSRPGSAPARRAPPRSAATGCTWRSARPSWAHPS